MRRVVSLAVALVLASAATAVAQEPGTNVGGDVPSLLGIGVTQPDGLTSFPAGARSATASLEATVTATDPGASISVVDGDTAAGTRLGRLTSAGAVLGDPLRAGVSGVFAPLDDELAPVLIAFPDPVANRKVTVELRQRLDGTARRGPYRKTVLVTLATEAP